MEAKTTLETPSAVVKQSALPSQVDFYFGDLPKKTVCVKGHANQHWLTRFDEGLERLHDEAVEPFDLSDASHERRMIILINLADGSQQHRNVEAVRIPRKSTEEQTFDRVIEILFAEIPNAVVESV